MNMKTKTAFYMKLSVLAVSIALFALSSAWAGGQGESASSTHGGKSGGTLTVFVNAGPGEPILEAAFKKDYPNVTLNWDTAGAQQYETILKTKIVAGEPPDIMTVWSGARAADYAARGYLKDLTNTTYIPKVVPSLNAQFSYKGKAYAVANSVNGEGLFIDKGLLDKIGEQVPADWSQLLAVAAAFKAHGILPFSEGYKTDYMIQRYTNSAFATLGYGRDPKFDAQQEAGKIDFSYKGYWKEVFDDLRVLIDKGYMGSAPLATDDAQATAVFSMGKAGMMISGSWELPSIRKAAPKMQLVFTALPVNGPGKTLFGCWNPGTGYAVSSNTKNWEAANHYLELFANPTLNKKIDLAAEGFSTFKGVEVKGLDPALTAFVAKFVATGHSYPGAHYQWPAGMSNNWKKKLQQFVGGVITTDQMITWLNQTYKIMSKQR